MKVLTIWDEISKQITSVTDEEFKLLDCEPIGGGCINEAYKISDEERHYFVKLNAVDKYAMFVAEQRGLEEILESQTLRVPTPIVCAKTENKAFLVLEYLTLSANDCAQKLGEQLASMHKTTTDEFGWRYDNTIGATPQINTPNKDWLEFWRIHRLEYQLELAGRNGYRGKLDKLGDKLMEKFPVLFANYKPQPSLLHGDLWGGNYASDQRGRPVIYDPAVYYGDRETDIAMTELFGGFDRNFYAAYNANWPLDDDYPTRRVLYNIYHILNHFNLFSGGYGKQAENMLQSLLAEIS